MPQLRTADGALLFVIDDPADGNSVVYDAETMQVLFNRQAWQQQKGVSNGPPPIAPPDDRPGRPPDPAPGPTPPPPGPLPHPGNAGVVIRVTSEAEGRFRPRQMSYWATAWVSGTTAYVFGGHDDGSARLYGVDLATGAVTRQPWPLRYAGETEGWSWTRDGRIMLIDGPRLRRVDPFTGAEEVVGDISESHPGDDLWQSHSSDDGQTHSATVRDPRQLTPDGAYVKVGTAIFRAGRPELFFDAQGTLDESQISRNGRYVVIKEDRGRGTGDRRLDDNRRIDLHTRETTWLRDEDRAMGHSDCGPDYIVGEADKPDPGMCGWWDLTQPLTPERFHPLFPTTNLGYVSVRGDRILHSGETHLSLVDRHTGAYTPLVAHWGGTSYDDRVKANLSPCGRVACYMVGGSVYLLVL